MRISVNKNNEGITHLLLIGAVVLIAVVAFAAYRVMQNQKSDESASQQTAATATAVPQTINSATDLEQAASAANSTNIDGDLNPAQLDSDIDQLQ